MDNEDVPIHEIELKHCPFCGRNATMIRHPGHNWDGKDKIANVGATFGLWYVGCSYQFFESLDSEPRCEINPNGGWWGKLEDGVNAWNKRY